MTDSMRQFVKLATEIPAIIAIIMLMTAGCGNGAAPHAPAAADVHAGETAEEHAAHADGGNEAATAGEQHACSGDHAEGEPHPPCTTCPNQKSSANWIIDIGEHAFLGRIDLFADEGRVVLTVYDHETREVHPHRYGETVLNLLVEGGSKQVAMEPLSGDEDLIGETRQYQACDESLKGLKVLQGRLNITMDDKTYVCELSPAH